MGQSTFVKTKWGQGVRALSVFACLLLFCLLLAPQAFSQSVNDVQARLGRIENEIQTLSRALFRGEQPPPDFVVGGNEAGRADIDDRLAQMENDLRTLTGKVEEQAFQVGQLRERLDKALSDMEMRVGALEAQSRVASPPPGGGGVGMQTVSPYAPPQDLGAGSQPGGFAPPGAAAPTGSLSAQDGGAMTAYGRAFATLQGGDYEGAASAFEAFLATHPNDPLAPNAQYWLGESYYARKDYVQSARVFAEAYRKYPKSGKTSDSLLKLALSLAGQGKKDDACVTLGQLRKEFPDGAGPVLSRGAEEEKNLGCPKS